MPYIAAKLASLPATFTLGDEKRYNGYYNKPLNSAQEYLCFVLADLRHEGADNTANYVRSARSYHDLIASMHLYRRVRQDEIR